MDFNGHQLSKQKVNKYIRPKLSRCLRNRQGVYWANIFMQLKGLAQGTLVPVRVCLLVAVGHGGCCLVIATVVVILCCTTWGP